MSVKIEISGVMVEFASISEATKAHAAQMAIESLKPAVDVITRDNAEITDWILVNRAALVAIIKNNAAAEKKELLTQLAAAGSWLAERAARISITQPKLSPKETAARITAGVIALTKGDHDLAVFITANYEDIREAVKPKLNEAALAGRELFLADCRAEKAISDVRGELCRTNYAAYKAAVAGNTVAEFFVELGA